MSDKETGENKYFYPPLDFTLRKKENYIKREQRLCMKTHFVEESKYWGLKLYSVLRVNRDREFFAKIKPQLYEFWNEVLEIRNEPSLYEERYGKKKRRTYKKPVIQTVTVSGFSDDDFD